MKTFKYVSWKCLMFLGFVCIASGILVFLFNLQFNYLFNSNSTHFENQYDTQLLFDRKPLMANQQLNLP